jgi:hypothetical protein
MFKGFFFLLLFGVAFGFEPTTILVDQLNPPNSNRFYIKTVAGSFLLKAVLVSEAEKGFFACTPAIYANPALRWVPGDRLEIERLEGPNEYPIKFTNIETQEVAYGKCNNYENISLELLHQELECLAHRLKRLEDRLHLYTPR